MLVGNLSDRLVKLESKWEDECPLQLKEVYDNHRSSVGPQNLVDELHEIR